MTKGDNLIGKETFYKGFKMKSKLESKIAYFLDALNIKWEYEPKTFVLSNGETYIPDFYLTELKMWLEVKGDIQEHNYEFSRIFVKDNHTELILISNEQAIWFSDLDFSDGLCEDKTIFIGLCHICNHYFFTSQLGDYHCRNCGEHNGDHDLLYGLSSNYYDNDKIDFYDTDSIKRGLKQYGVSI